MTALALILSVAAAVLLLAAGPGVRLGAWTFITGFSLIRWAVIAGAVGIIVSIVALVVARRRGRPALPAAAALAIAAVTVCVPLFWIQRARGSAPIHDITTDVVDPPAFVAVLPLRANALNPAEYGGADVARQQQTAYPDIRPLHLAAPPAAAFSRALDDARASGWEIVAADTAAGRIEATATTTWFGFKDDVVVRVRPDSAGSRIDVRSVSRVGGGDVGTNARRVRAYLARLAGG